MRYTKEICEELIASSKLFELDRDSQNVAYRKESLKMVEYLYCYLLAINKDKYEPYACEIVDVATRCINRFDGSREFLHYFNAAWKKEYAHICGDEIVEKKFQGMKLSEQEKRDIKKYMRLLSRNAQGMSDVDKYIKIAELMEISVEDVKRIAESADTQVVSEYKTDSDGDEISNLNQVSDEFSIEGHFESRASIEELLDRLEGYFRNLQERQKPIVSDMLTIKIGLDIYEVEKLSKTYSFISEEITDIIKKSGKLPTQRDIAVKYGKNEASISRTMKEFLTKVRKGEENNGT